MRRTPFLFGGNVRCRVLAHGTRRQHKELTRRRQQEFSTHLTYQSSTLRLMSAARRAPARNHRRENEAAPQEGRGKGGAIDRCSADTPSCDFRDPRTTLRKARREEPAAPCQPGRADH
jgi:hypothetical protein